MSEIRIESMDDGLELINGVVSIQVIHIKASPTRRYAEFRVMRPDGSALYLPQRLDILNPQDVAQFLANLTVNESSIHWDAMLAQLGAALAQLLDHIPETQILAQTDGKSPLDAVLSHRDLRQREIPERKSLVGFLV